MNIVTGYMGFIGSHICDRISDIFAVEQNDCFEFLQNFKDWSKVKFIYHLGAISDTTCTDIAKIYKYNIDFSLQLFEKAIEYQIPVRYASSASVYGNTHNSINPLNYYSMSKATIDLWVQDNISRFSHIQGLRFFNVYGDGEENKFNQASPVSKFRKEVKERGTISIFEDSEFYYRDFICVEDIAEIMVNNNLDSGIYDLGTSRPISFKTVARLMQQKYGGTIQTTPFPNHLIGKYQTSTKAREVFPHTFKSLSQWLEESNH
jgi:ADP-L-glycero-D-manno-heptose 6-epimerase